MNLKTTLRTAALVTWSLAAGLGVGTAAHAAESNTWHAQTCAAYQAYSGHPTYANLEALAADSFHVPWRGSGGYGLGVDIWGLVSDVRSGSVKYIPADKRYIQKDC